MKKITKKYIWDYDIKRMDFNDPEVLIWYLQRQIEYGEWERINLKILKKYLPILKINPYLKLILRNFLKKYG